MALSIKPRALRSHGDYLCLRDAGALVGRRLVDAWKESDLDAPNGVKPDVETNLDAATIAAAARAERVYRHLLRMLSGGILKAFGQDHEGAFHEIERERLSKPYFDINITHSLFQWSYGEWDAIFVSKNSLTHHLKEISTSKNRKSTKYDWRDMTCIAWKLALEGSSVRDQAVLLGAVQDAFVAKYDSIPDPGEIRPLVTEIIDFLDGRVLSRDVSEP